MNHINFFLTCHKHLSQEVQLNMLLSIYYTWKKYKNNKLKVIAPTLNDEFELQGGSYPLSDIQGYIA